MLWVLLPDPDCLTGCHLACCPGHSPGPHFPLSLHPAPLSSRKAFWCTMSLGHGPLLVFLCLQFPMIASEFQRDSKASTAKTPSLMKLTLWGQNVEPRDFSSRRWFQPLLSPSYQPYSTPFKIQPQVSQPIIKYLLSQALFQALDIKIIMIANVVENLPYTRHCFKCFPYINSFNPNHSSMGGLGSSLQCP